jgi:hypothetical protein
MDVADMYSTIYGHYQRGREIRRRKNGHQEIIRSEKTSIKSRDTVLVKVNRKNKYELTCISAPILTIHFAFVWSYTGTRTRYIYTNFLHVSLFTYLTIKKVYWPYWDILPILLTAL